jgi:hypothetical protein
MRARTDTNTLAYLNAQGIDGKATTKRHVVSTIMHTYTCFLFHVAPAVGASSNLGAPCQEVRCYTPHLYGTALCRDLSTEAGRQQSAQAVGWRVGRIVRAKQ